jgi:hypothetical protein
MFSTKQFHADPKTQTMDAEISDLGGQSIHTRLYNDACDAGFLLQSHVTGKTSAWVQVAQSGGYDEDSDGEVTSWTFRPTYETLREHPQLANWKILVWND